MKRTIILTVFLFLVISVQQIVAQKSEEPDSLKNISLTGLSFRSIGPAVTGEESLTLL